MSPGPSSRTDRPQGSARARLPANVLARLRDPPGQLVAIVASVDADGRPRTATFGVMRASIPHTLRFGCRPTHTTYANIRRDGRVMVALHGPPDVAVGIAGRARVVREQLDAWPDNALIDVEVSSVKDDQHPELAIEAGVTYAMPAEVAKRLEAVNAELDAPNDE